MWSFKLISLELWTELHHDIKLDYFSVGKKKNLQRRVGESIKASSSRYMLWKLMERNFREFSLVKLIFLWLSEIVVIRSDKG